MLVQEQSCTPKVKDPVLFNAWQGIMKHPNLRYFNWGILYNQIYATTDPFCVDRGLLRKLQRATLWCNRIYGKVAQIITRDRRMLNLLGIDPELHRFCRKFDPTVPLSTIGRFDFAVDEAQNIKLLEFNIDTPTGIVEAVEVNALVAHLQGLPNPNDQMLAHIRGVFLNFVQGRVYKNVVFTSLGWHLEDRGTTQAVLEYSGLPGKYLPLSELKVTGGGLYDPAGQRIDLLWRLYPVELFFQEEEGCQLLDLVVRDQLTLLNPPIAFVLQSKVVLCVIWELLNTPFFTDEEKAAVRQYFLPSYLESTRLLGQQYVKKPAYGREGGGVYLYNKEGLMLEGNTQPEYEGTMIYQRKASLYPYHLKTWAGDFQGQLVFGSFVIRDAFAGLFLRLGGAITKDDSLYVPVCIKD